MKYSISKLDNGVKVVSIPMPSMKSVAVMVWAGAGSRYEDKKINGISHFLEHMVFKGGKKRKTAKEVAEAVDSIGAAINASTSREITNFYIKARAGLLEKAFDILSDVVLYPQLRDEDIERERGVILEEIAMTDDTPMDKIGDVFMQLIFKGSRLGMDISGTKETVANIKKNDFVRYRKRYYESSNIVISVAGGIDNKSVRNLADKYFGKVISGKEQRAKKFETKQEKPMLSLFTKESEQAHFILGYLGHKRTYKDKYAESVLSTILGSGMSSRLFVEIRVKRGLAYAVSTLVQRYADTGIFATYAGVDLKRIDEAISAVLAQCKALSDNELPVSKQELTKAKEYMKGHLALSLENTMAVSSFFGKKVLFEETVETPEDVFARIDKVSIADLQRVVKNLFVPEKLNLAVIGPFKDKSRFEKLIT